MATIAGQRRTDNIASTQRAIDLSNPINLLEPNAAPITVITKQIQNGGKRRRTVDTKYTWHNDELEGRFDAVNDATPPNAAATVVTVDTPTLFGAEFLVKVPRTGEVVLVESIAGNDLTIKRGIGGTTAADFVDNDPLYVIGYAGEEGDTSPPARSTNPVPVDNYTQIFRTPVEASGSRMAAQNLSQPHDWPHQRKKAGIEHLKDIELAFLLGGPSADAGGASAVGDRRTTGGLLHFLTQNAVGAGGTLTEVEVEEWLRAIFRYGGQKRTVFASALVVSVLNQFSQGKLNTFVGAESYGVRVSEWISAHGVVKLVKHNLLEGATYSGYAIAVDVPEQLGYRFLGGGPGGDQDTKLLTNRQENDRYGQKDEFLSEVGAQVEQPKLGGVLSGVTG